MIVCLMLAVVANALPTETVEGDMNPTGRGTTFAPLGGGAPVPTTCPAWAKGEDYTFIAAEWGNTKTVNGGPGTALGLIGTGDPIAQFHAACAWVAACNGNDECYARCPVAMAIGKGEGGWFPGAYAWDGNGRGLWQVNYANLPGQTGQTRCGYHPGNGDVPTPTSPTKCDAYNPVWLAGQVIGLTGNGDNFSPTGKCWSTCTAACNTFAPCYDGSHYPSAGFHGPQIAADSTTACTNAIRDISGKQPPQYKQIETCIVGKTAKQTCGGGGECPDGSAPTCQVGDKVQKCGDGTQAPLGTNCWNGGLCHCSTGTQCPGGGEPTCQVGTQIQKCGDGTQAPLGTNCWNGGLCHCP